MTVHDALQQSEVILIEGSKKSGKLTFILFELSKQKNKKILVLSSYPKHIFKKRLNAISFIKDKALQETIKKLKYLNLKEDWEDYKLKFGYKFLLEDIKRIIKNFSPDVLIFHRIDMIFSISDIEEIKNFMEELIEIKGKTQLFLTAVVNKDNTSCIEIIENFSDLNLIMKKNDRTIAIKHSIFPLQYEECKFVYDGHKLNLAYQKEALKPLSKKKILLATNNKRLLEINKYIFDKPLFNLEIASNTSDIISKILENPDVVIYTSENIDINICKMKEKIDSKILYIVDKEYVRTEDKMLAIQKGCEEILPNTFSIAEYILEIEKLLNLHFYSTILNKFPKYKIATSFENFCNIVNSLYLERIVFTIIKFSSTLNVEEIANKLRNKDVIYFDGTFYYIALINIRKENLDPILEKFNIIRYDAIESFRWEKRGICK